ncbi:hypothetical protein SAMN04488498_12740 [Mesorhizobium albiziae]|uniref:Uncharacterized protein n=1 Tax=Neomesorhizobium albiziae TaxID=335020 RepID=A0A1I4ELU2_9HYPH|nr:hypothetical protein [Mesorhizobium albiziae]GLS34391.1 hypothetical protein GCM10007937_61060 [Mesorhizobium albiziae]SFL06040.1 hypothetical protein SAMN04488498_12740 [Mesorhizobium albiziae]
MPKVGSKASRSDTAVEFIKPNSVEARAINAVLLKEVDKARHTAGQVIDAMRAEGYPKFNQAAHTRLWKELDAKDPTKGFGKAGDHKNTWVWFASWLARVRAHCQENASKNVAAV